MFRRTLLALVALTPVTTAQLPPREEQATFRVPAGFKVELAAAEPEVVDPVSMCFDERGRAFVCEMIGYPNGGVGTGNESRGRVRLLTDTDGDGVYETAAVYAAGLRFPMGIVPWKNGVIVAVAPDIRFLEDTDGDGKADHTTVLYEGFNTANIQQMVNGLTWGPDGWVYGVAGNAAGTIRSPQKPDAQPVMLGSRGFRFRPDVPGSLEPTSGGGQYGLTADEFGHWFVNTNSEHLKQIVFPDHYLRRNPAATVTATTVNITDHGAACKVFRVSPFEAWRVERTTRRAGGADARRFPPTELIPGGFVTSGCSPLVVTGGLFPAAYRGNVLTCDPANNLIHRDILRPNGSAFTAARGDADCEFLASTDNWFRPVHLCTGPDGAVYVLDFYREVIETPLSLPDDIKAKLKLESRDRGRMWRIAPAGTGPRPVTGFGDGELAERLVHPNSWVRQTAQRLILERRPAGAADAIVSQSAVAAGSPSSPAVLYTLAALDRLPDSLLVQALTDPLPGNREVALRLTEPRLSQSAEVRSAVMKLTADPSAMVRYQLALSAVGLPVADRTRVLSALLAGAAGDGWVTAAVFCSAGQSVVPLVAELAATAGRGAAALPVLSDAAAVAARQGEAGTLLRQLPDGDAGFAVLEGLGRGLRERRQALPGGEPVASRLTAAAGRVADESGPVAGRVAAARALAFAPYDTASPALAAALGPQSPPDVQLAAVRSLSIQPNASVAGLLLAAWPSAGPGVRRELLEALLARPDRVGALLDAVEKGTIRVGEIDPLRVAQLRAAKDVILRARAEKLFATGSGNRRTVVEKYQSVATINGDAGRGKAMFQTHCAACHKLGTVGHTVGPDLVAVLGGKGTAELLVAVLDPNREVDSRYVNYTLTTTDGRTVTGIVTGDGTNAVTLRRADGAEETVHRADIESLKSTGQSLMPEGLEASVPPAAMADLFAYLREQAGKK